MKTLVLGLGNPILGDDSVGLRVARVVRELLKGEDIAVEESTSSGLALLDLVVGYDRAIIVDAIQKQDSRVGDVHRLALADVDTTRHSASPHDATFTASLELGKALGMAVPGDIAIVAVSISEDCNTFTEECSAEVEKAIPLAARMVIEEVRRPQEEQE